MEHFALYLAILGCVLLAGVALNRFSQYMKMPLLICFLGVGILCGRHGMDIFPPFQMKPVQLLGEVALCFIIFTGGLQTSYQAIRKVFVTGTILATIGVVLTAFITAVCVFFVSRMSLFLTLDFPQALCVGAIFASTDAAAVFAILRGQKASINPRLQSLLEYESGSNDPAAFLLTSVMIGIISSQNSVDLFGVTWNIASGIVWGLGIGACLGFLLGVFCQWFYNWIHNFLEYNGLRLVVAVAVVLIGYGISNAIFQANALMTCYVAGITMGNMRFNFKQSFIRFHEGISWLMQILLFTILGAFFDYHMLFNFRNMLGAVIISVVLMFIARPLVVMLCMIRSPFNIRERIFTSWVGIRGSAPIMLAAMVLAASSPDFYPHSQNLFYLVFTVVLLSILLQGSSLMWAAKKLGLVMPYEEQKEQLLEYDERADGREMCQFSIGENNPLIDRSAGDFTLENIVLLMIRRGESFIQPDSRAVLKKGDALTFLGEQRAMKELHRNFFPQEPYTPSLTFGQLWEVMLKWTTRKRRRKVADFPKSH